MVQNGYYETPAGKGTYQYDLLDMFENCTWHIFRVSKQDGFDLREYDSACVSKLGGVSGLFRFLESEVKLCQKQ